MATKQTKDMAAKSGTIDTGGDRDCWITAARAQSELIEMLATFVLKQIERDEADHDGRSTETR